MKLKEIFRPSACGISNVVRLMSIASLRVLLFHLIYLMDLMKSNRTRRRILEKFTSVAAALGRSTLETHIIPNRASLFCLCMLGDWFPLEMDFLHNEIVFYGKRTSGATKAQQVCGCDNFGCRLCKSSHESILDEKQQKAIIGRN